MKKRIYGYYESLQGFHQDEEFACANAWKQSWEKHGWECVMLNDSHAKNSNFYFKLAKKLVELSGKFAPSSGDNLSKICARYKRWCALHAAGGGWMSDYDVTNINFPSAIADSHEKDATLLIVSGEPAYLFYATQQHCSAALTKFLSEDLDLDGAARHESDVLNIQGNLDAIAPLLFHAKKTKEKRKSAEMMEFLQ